MITGDPTVFMTDEFFLFLFYSRVSKKPREA